MTARPPKPLIELTARQGEVLTLIALGHQQQYIAAELKIQISMVRTLTRQIYERLGTLSGAHAVALGIGLGLLPVDVATNPPTPSGGSRVR